MEVLVYKYIFKITAFLGACTHGHLQRTAHKLSATKIEHSYWSTGNNTHLWLADKSQTNLWAVLSTGPWLIYIINQIEDWISASFCKHEEVKLDILSSGLCSWFLLAGRD